MITVVNKLSNVTINWLIKVKNGEGNNLSIRILFAGSPDIAVPALGYLNQCYTIVAVLTAPDAPVGRKAVMTPPPVKVHALALGLTVVQPEKINAEFTAHIQSLHPDILVCFAYGKIFPQSFLDLFPVAAINLHPSLLPHWRGPSPIQAVIMAGESVTGITVQHMVKDMDAGPIVLQEKLILQPQETTLSLGQGIGKRAGSLLQQAITMIMHKTSPDIPQNHAAATYCYFITKETGHLNYENSAYQLECLVRAMYDSPIAYTRWQDKLLHVFHAVALDQQELNLEPAPIGQVVQYHKEWGLLVQTKDGFLALQELQLAGKKRLSHKEFMNGYSYIVGDRLE